MGADLYIPSIHDKLRNQYEDIFYSLCNYRDILSDLSDDKEKKIVQKEVNKVWDLMYSEGYFRDSYNPSNLLWHLSHPDFPEGISWWGTIGHIIDEKSEKDKTQDEDGVSLIKVKEILHIIKESKINTRQIEIDIEKGELRGTYEEWLKYFKEKKEDLENFLQTCIKLKEKPRFSI